LNQILFAHDKKQKICVSELIAMTEIASPATIHAALKKLVAKNLLQFTTTPNNRTKFIELTETGHQSFILLSNLLKKSK
jgi:DNA-binding MarR family transcriptional regulator